MKTSNKLLIILAISLLIVPIIVVAINVKINYKSLKEWSKDVTSLDQFDSETAGFKKEKLSQAFTAINFHGQDNIGLNIILINTNAFGYKVSENAKDLIQIKVDANGTLQIATKKDLNTNYSKVTLAIYAPKIAQLAVNNLLQLEITAKADSLGLILEDLSSVLINVNSKINKLEVIGNRVNNFNQSREVVNELTIDLKDSQFETLWTSYKKLSINASGKSTVSISGDDQDKQKYKIDILNIHSTGAPSIHLWNIDVVKSFTNFSDSTMVNMPAQYLKNTTTK